MAEVKIFELGAVEEKECTRVVCMSRLNGKWVYVRKKGKETWEIPGGHIEKR